MTFLSMSSGSQGVEDVLEGGLMLWLEEQKETLPRLKPCPVLAVDDHRIQMYPWRRGAHL